MVHKGFAPTKNCNLKYKALEGIPTEKVICQFIFFIFVAIFLPLILLGWGYLKKN